MIVRRAGRVAGLSAFAVAGLMLAVALLIASSLVD